jgi:hypothetical protein
MSYFAQNHHIGNEAPCYVVQVNNIKTRTQQDVSTKTSKKQISN